MTWLIIGILIWIAVAIPVALVIGRSIRLAESRRKQELQARTEANFIATDAPPATAPAGAAAAPAPPADGEERPWTGPSTVPFAPSRLPWGGQRPSGRRVGQPPLRAHAPHVEPSAPTQGIVRD